MTLFGPDTKETAYVCPDCGSPSIEYSLLSGSNGTCKACGWMGPKDKLLGVPFASMGSTESMFNSLRSDLRKIVSKMSSDLVPFFVKWGLVEAVQRNGRIEVTNMKQALRYVNAIAQATLVAVLTERQKIEKERISGG
jgi:hypothetical protein